MTLRMTPEKGLDLEGLTTKFTGGIIGLWLSVSCAGGSVKQCRACGGIKLLFTVKAKTH